MLSIVQVLPISGMEHSGWRGIEITDEWGTGLSTTSMSDCTGNKEDFFFFKQQQKKQAQMMKGVMQ